MNIYQNFDDNLNVAVIGASGGIGQGFVKHLCASTKTARIYSFSRNQGETHHEKIIYHPLDLTDERSIVMAAAAIPDDIKLDIVIIAAGVLHDGDLQPEKSLKDLDFQKFQNVFAVNTIGPALVMKYFLPKMQKEKRSVFAALSARVGSISDNQIGGWYAYRASKAALNMLIKNASIEMARRYKEAVIIALHPGTVDTDLSKPFQGHVPSHKLFTSDQATEKMLMVIDQVMPKDSGKIFDYAGDEIQP